MMIYTFFIFLDLLCPYSHAFLVKSMCSHMHIQSRFCNTHVEIFASLNIIIITGNMATGFVSSEQAPSLASDTEVIILLYIYICMYIYVYIYIHIYIYVYLKNKFILPFNHTVTYCVKVSLDLNYPI
jgi:hypothetical protein